MLKYVVKMSEYQIKDLSDDALDAAFVVKATDLQEKITNKSLSEEEVEAIDDELCELFDECHDFEEVNAPELTDLQTQNTVFKGKEALQSANSLEDVNEILEKYNAFPEVVELCNKKIEGLNAQQSEVNELETARAKMQADVAKATTLDELTEITKEYDNKDPWIVELVQGRANEIKASNQEKQEQKSKGLKEKLMSQRVWSYEQLKEIGINVTGQDMVVEGVKMKRTYLFKAYERES